MITAETALKHFTQTLEQLYGDPVRARWSTIPEHADKCGAILLFGCGGSIETGSMIYEDLIDVSRLIISAHGAGNASPDSPYFSYNERIEEPVLTFFIHLNRQDI